MGVKVWLSWNFGLKKRRVLSLVFVIAVFAFIGIFEIVSEQCVTEINEEGIRSSVCHTNIHLWIAVRVEVGDDIDQVVFENGRICDAKCISGSVAMGRITIDVEVNLRSNLENGDGLVVAVIIATSDGKSVLEIKGRHAIYEDKKRSLV